VLELASVVFLGLVVGSIYSLTAVGLVLTYRTSGVFNFAHGAVGMFFAYVFFQLTQGGRVNLVFFVHDQRWRVPVPVALILVIGVLAPAMGLGLHRVLFRGLGSAGSLVKIVATIGVLVSLIGVAGVVWSNQTLTPRSIFPQAALGIGEFRATVEEIATILLAIALSIALMAFLRFSSLGVRMRAVVDRPDVAELMGVDSTRTSAVAWAIGSGFAALAGILLVPFFGSLDPLTLSLLVITAAAAAVVGRLESLPVTLLAGFGIGVAQFIVQRYTSTDLGRQLQPTIPFMVLFVVLLLPITFREVAERGPGLAIRRRVRSRGGPWGPLAMVAVLIVLPFLVSTDWQSKLATVPPMAIILLSLVILSGVAGQISLGQAAFAGFGAFIAAHLVVSGWSLLPAAAVGALAAVPLGALLAARAARLPPLFLGFATLAFGAVMDQVAFTSNGFSGGLTGIAVDRPSFLEGDRAYYLAVLVVFGVVALLVRNLRRGRTGLALAAMHESPVGIASLGTSVGRLKFAAFCFSAFVAGLGGAFLAGSVRVATPFNFFEVQSLIILALAVIGGIATWPGALIGAVLLQLTAPFLHQPFVSESFIGQVVFHGQLEALLPVFFGLGAIGLARNPGGIIEQARDGMTKAAERWRAFRARAVSAGPSLEPEPSAAADGRRPTAGPVLVTFPAARFVHRPDCLLTTGKAHSATPVAGTTKLLPCPVCRPDLGTVPLAR
jgi:branched-chain amino acid transport system permease protein